VGKPFPDMERLTKKINGLQDEIRKLPECRNVEAQAAQIQYINAVIMGLAQYIQPSICSFAYGMPYAVVDGNVFRVLSRYFGIDTPIDSTTGKKLFTALAQDNLDESCPAEYNQAMMDFGALQCTPQSPACMYCPLAETCVAFRTGMAEELPVKQQKLSVKTRHFNYLWVKAGEYTYINKRTEKDIWQNLYELPLVESEHELSQIELLERMKPWLTDDEEIQLDLLIQGVKHVLTHRVIMANFYQVTLPPGSSSFSSFIMVKPESLASYAFPRLITSFLNKSH